MGVQLTVFGLGGGADASSGKDELSTSTTDVEEQVEALTERADASQVQEAKVAEAAMAQSGANVSDSKPAVDAGGLARVQTRKQGRLAEGKAVSQPLQITKLDDEQAQTLNNLSEVMEIVTAFELNTEVDQNGNDSATGKPMAEALNQRLLDSGFDNVWVNRTTNRESGVIQEDVLSVGLGENSLSLVQRINEETMLQASLVATGKSPAVSFNTYLNDYAQAAIDSADIVEQENREQVEAIVSHIKEYFESTRRSIEYSNSALEGENPFEVVAIGAGGAVSSLIDLVKLGGSLVADGAEYLYDESKEIASELYNRDKDALKARMQKGLENLEGTVEFIGDIPSKAEELADQLQQVMQVIEENPEIYNAFKEEIADTADDVSGKQMVMAVGAVIGELLIGAATLGTGNIAKAGKGAVTSGKLVESLLELAAKTKNVTGTAARRATESVVNTVEGLRTGRLVLQSPVRLNTEKLIGRLNSGPPLDAVEGQSIFKKIDVDVPDNIQLNSRVRYSDSLVDDTFDPIPFDQGVLDEVVRFDPALSNVKLSVQPKINPELDIFGRSYRRFNSELNVFDQPVSEVGSRAFRNRSNLIGTIVHEETHLRFAKRVDQGGVRTLRIDARGIEAEEIYVRAVEKRFLQMQQRRLGNE